MIERLEREKQSVDSLAQIKKNLHLENQEFTLCDEASNEVFISEDVVVKLFSNVSKDR